MTRKKQIFLLLPIGFVIGFLAIQLVFPAEKRFIESHIGDFHSQTGYFLAASHAENISDYEKASGYYEKLLEKDSKNEVFHKKLYSNLIFGGEFKKAKKFITEYKNGFEKDRLGQFLFLTEAMSKNDFKKATETLLKMKNKKNKDKIALPLLEAWLLAAQQKKEQSFKALEKLNTKDTNILYLTHSFYLSDYFSDKNQAEKTLEKFKDKKGTIHFVERVFQFYCRDNKHEKAVIFAKKHLPSNSYIAESLMKKIKNNKACAPALTAQKGFAEALTDLSLILATPKTADLSLFLSRLAINLNPEFYFTTVIMGELFEKQELLEMAESVFKSVPKNHYLYPSAVFKLARVYNKSGEKDRAIKTLKSLIKNSPDYLFANLLLGEIYIQNRDYKKAHALYKKTLKDFSAEKLTWEVYYFLGLTSDWLGEKDVVEGFIQKALEKSPENPIVMNYLGYFWIEKNTHTKEAMELIQKALTRMPMNLEFWDSYGWALFKLGEHEKAAHILEIATQRNSSHSEIHDDLGDVYNALGRTREALFQWKKALFYSDVGLGIKNTKEIEEKISEVEN